MALGALVKTTYANENSDITNLSKGGVYFLKVTTSKGTKTKKLVKTKT